MPQTLNYLRETASQTAGPYVHIGLAPGAAGFKLFETELGQDITGPNAIGERIIITGRVLDGTGSPVRDVLLETWQANSAGIYAHEEDPRHQEVEDGFSGWGRIISDFDTGEFKIETIKPGASPGRNGTTQAPHINLWIVSRGINIGLNTRIYFEEDGEAHAHDPILNLIEQVHRRDTLLAQKIGDNSYQFDVVLQGAKETVFFDV